MSLKYQLERTDLTVTIEQGRRVEADLYAENHRTIQTMGELLKARTFSATPFAISMRRRMTNYVQGEGKPGAMPRRGEGDQNWLSPSPRMEKPGSGSHQEPTGLQLPPPPEPHPDLDTEGWAPPSRLDLTVEPVIGRLKVPTRWRKDESDR